MIRLKALIAVGTIERRQRVDQAPSPSRPRNVGIMPPLNSIVNTTINMMALRPIKSLRDKPYAINAVIPY